MFVVRLPKPVQRTSSISSKVPSQRSILVDDLGDVPDLGLLDQRVEVTLEILGNLRPTMPAQRPGLATTLLLSSQASTHPSYTPKNATWRFPSTKDGSSPTNPSSVSGDHPVTPFMLTIFRLSACVGTTTECTANVSS